MSAEGVTDAMFEVPPLPTAEQVKRFGMDGDGPYPTIAPGAMTLTQLDTLRHQIAAYAHLCEQRALLTQQIAEESKPGQSRSQTLAAIANSLGVSGAAGAQPSYPGPVYSKGGDGPRGSRWSPNPTQLARLEELFATGMGTPNGDIRTKITDELTKLGPVNEANVYNWFQNKKARTKKKAMEELAAANFTRIEELDVSWNALGGIGEEVREQKKLRKLDVSGNSGVGAR